MRLQSDSLRLAMNCEINQPIMQLLGGEVEPDRSETTQRHDDLRSIQTVSGRLLCSYSC